MQVGGVNNEALRQYIERIEKVELDLADYRAHKADVYAEAKSQGFDVKALREIIKLRKLRADERAEQEYMLDLYKRASGLVTDMEE